MDGYIYVLSNKALNKNIYKIGLTKKNLNQRVNELSKSTSIPVNFVLEYSRKTNNVNLSERRIHLVLDNYRYSKNKEFFKLKLESIKLVVDKILEDFSNNDDISNIFYLHNDLLKTNYKPNLTANGYKILDLMMCSTKNNSLLYQFIDMRNSITDGFISADYLSNNLNISRRSAQYHLRKFCEKFHKLELYFYDEDISLRIFEDLRYDKGELTWLFDIRFKKYFFR